MVQKYKAICFVAWANMASQCEWWHLSINLSASAVFRYDGGPGFLTFLSLSFSPAVDHLMNASSKFFIAGNISIQHSCSTPGQDLDYSLCQLFSTQKHGTNAVKIYEFTPGLARGWITVRLSTPPYVPWMNIQNFPSPTPCRINHLWSSICSLLIQIRNRKWILSTRGKHNSFPCICKCLPRNR